MTTHPLIDRQLGQYTERLVVKTEDIWRIEHAARQLRSREIARLARAAWTWVKTYLVEPIASALRAERAYRELMALDDRTLADIGIARSEISGIVARSIAPQSRPKRTVSVKAVASGRAGESPRAYQDAPLPGRADAQTQRPSGVSGTRSSIGAACAAGRAPAEGEQKRVA